jgi:hypothetical protein
VPAKHGVPLMISRSMTTTARAFMTEGNPACRAVATPQSVSNAAAEFDDLRKESFGPRITHRTDGEPTVTAAEEGRRGAKEHAGGNFGEVAGSSFGRLPVVPSVGTTDPGFRNSRRVGSARSVLEGYSNRTRRILEGVAGKHPIRRRLPGSNPGDGCRRFQSMRRPVRLHPRPPAARRVATGADQIPTGPRAFSAG